MPVCVTSTCVTSICAMSSCVMSVCVMSICLMSFRVMSSCEMPICGMSARVMSIFVMSSCVVSACARVSCQAVCPHARNTSTPNFRISYWHSYAEHNLHTARRQTRTPGRHQHKTFASPIGTATHAKFSHLLLAQLPGTQFTHSKAPNPHARKTSTQNFRISYWHSYPERNLHTASRQIFMPGRHPRKIFPPPIGTEPRGPRRAQRSKPHACDAKTKAEPRSPKRAKANIRARAVPQAHAHAERRSARRAKAYIRARVVLHGPRLPRLPRQSSGRAAEPKTRQTPATQKQRQSGGAQDAPKRTSEPVQCSKPHACHAKTRTERRSPKRAKAYIRARAVLQAPCLPRKSSGRAAEPKTRQGPCSVPSPAPATHKQRHSGGAPNAPKRTSEPARCSMPHACHGKAAAERRSIKRAKDYIRARAVLQAPRLPRKSSGRAAEPTTRQSVHQGPGSVPSPTPATQNVKLCDVKLCDVKLCDICVRVCVVEGAREERRRRRRR